MSEAIILICLCNFAGLLIFFVWFVRAVRWYQKEMNRVLGMSNLEEIHDDTEPDYEWQQPKRKPVEMPDENLEEKEFIKQEKWLQEDTGSTEKPKS